MHAQDLGTPPTPLDDLLAARRRARDAFRQTLLRLQKAAQTPGGVTREMEEECARVRAAWRKAESDLDAFLTRGGAAAAQA